MSDNNKSSVKDMTVGSPLKLILGFSIPMFLGCLFQQFYSVVDTLIVGRVLGEDALAAVGCTGPVNFLVVGCCIGLCSGFAIPISHKFGAGDYEGLRRCVANCLWVCLFFGTIITVVVSLNTGRILQIMKTPENIISLSSQYILIIFLGIPATVLYNMASGIIRAIGDSKTPLFFLILSSLMNIGLDLIFMVGLQAGVRGAALATIMSQAIAGILCLGYMVWKFEILRVRKGEWKLKESIIKNLCNMGLPMGLQYSITAIGSVILQSSVNTLGSDVVAAVTAAGKVSLFFCCAYDAMGAAMATYGGQNVGAKKLDRISEGLKQCLIIGFAYAVIAFVVLYFWAADLTGLFVKDPSAAMLSNSRLYLLVTASTYSLLAIVNIMRFLIQGMGFSKLAMLAGVGEMVARMIVGLILVPIFGLPGAAMASPLAWVFADSILIPSYIHVRKKLMHIFEVEPSMGVNNG